MNINGKSSQNNESVINIGLHVEAIDEDGNWSKAEIINIIDNNLILKFPHPIKSYSRIISISSDKWHHIGQSNDFEKGDFVLAKWHDNNYYHSKILDITTKTKFGTKVKEYHILYLYDNIQEIVSKSRLKCPNSSSVFNCDHNNKKLNFQESAIMNRSTRKTHKRKSDILDYHENDNIFYDSKTKKFTENCKLRRLKLSAKNDSKSDDLIQTNLLVADLSESIKELPLNFQNGNHSETLKLDHQKSPTQRYSQRRRRSPYKKADYFYPDSNDNVIKDKNKSSNNNSQMSTPIPSESNDDLFQNSLHLSMQYPFQNALEVKDCVPSSNHSPISVSFTSTEDSFNLKSRPEIINQSFYESGEIEFQSYYKSVNDGKYQCLICKNKTFRKQQLVLDHIKKFHQVKCKPLNEKISNKLPKTVYSPNKRYYSSYLKNNRTSIERKKKFNKSKIKALINRTSWNIYNNRNHKFEYKHRHNDSAFSLPCSSSDTVKTIFDESGSSRRHGNGLIYCTRCKKSSEVGYMVQCDVCLCWSHTDCYALNDQKDYDSFWECDNCANLIILDDSKNSNWYKDQLRFHSTPRNELPWLKQTSSSVSCNIRNICELQSFLSMSQRILEAITQHMDKLTFRNGNDSNSQDDLDILKNLYVYDNTDEMNRIETLDSIALPVDQEDIFHVLRVPDNIQGSYSTKTSTLNVPDIIQPVDNSLHFPFNEVTFSNSTPNKIQNTNHKSLNVSFDGIFDCEIQRLEFIPKADFDALVHDLNLNDDICKSSNLENISKSSILDLINDGCTVNNNNTDRVTVQPEMPFTHASCLFKNHEIEGCESIGELCNDDLTSLLLDKQSHKSSAILDNICIQGKEQVKSLTNYFSDSRLIPDRKHSLLEQPSSRNLLYNHTVSKTSISRPGKKFEIEFNDWTSEEIAADAGNLDNNSSTILDNNPLSSSDSQCLRWLWSKFKCVERIVESIEKTLLSSNILQGTSENIKEEYFQISRYLHSLLYILRKE